jgi:tetratricopeptide (TPR) repeat protein
MRFIVDAVARNYKPFAVFLLVGLAVVCFRPASGTPEQRAANLCAGAETALRHGDDETAMASYRDAIAIHPESVRARLGLTGLLTRRRRFTEAKETLMPISTLVSGPREWMDYARALRNARADEEAEAALKRAAEEIPDSPGPALALAELYLSTGNLDSAEYHYRRARSLGGARGGPHAGLGRIHFSRGALDSAAACFRLALLENPEDVDLLCDVAWNELQRKRAHAGIHHLRRAVALDPYHPRTRYLLGQTLLALGLEEEAGRNLEAFGRQSRLAGRIRVLEQSAAESPTAERYQTLSHFYSLAGRDSLAAACLQRATALNPLVTAPREAIGTNPF